MENKKAIGHIEVILSFVIFLGFLIFLFVFLNPLEQSKTNKSSLDDLEFALKNKLEVIVISQTVKINSGKIPNCFYINSDDVPNDVEKKVEIEKIENNLYKLRYSEVFDEKDCQSLTGDYELGLTKETRYFLKENLEKMKTKYETNYEDLKNELEVTDDFSVYVYDTSQNLVFEMKKQVPEKVNVLARNINIQYLVYEGEWKIKSGILNIRVWS